MTQLGNIFDGIDDPPPGDNPSTARGTDLHVRVAVPRVALGADRPFDVDVPLTLAGLRRADPHGDGAKVSLHLPKALPDGATLRLRGLGARPEDPTQAAGDLFVAITLTDGPWDNDHHAKALSVELIVAAIAIAIALFLIVAIAR